MKTIALAYLVAMLSLLVEFTYLCAAPLASELDFDQFPAKIYKGRTHLPEFQARDKRFREYRTMILKALKAGPSFAGEFSVVEIGCGTDCDFVFVASNRTGEVFELNSSSGPYLLQYRANSRLLVIQSGSPWLPSSPCQLEWYVWGGRQTKHVKTAIVGSGETCANSIDDNLEKLRRP